MKAVISALDGVLAAEEEAKISAGLEMPGRALQHVGQSRKQLAIQVTFLTSQIVFLLALGCAFAYAPAFLRGKDIQHHKSM